MSKLCEICNNLAFFIYICLILVSSFDFFLESLSKDEDFLLYLHRIHV